MRFVRSARTYSHPSQYRPNQVRTSSAYLGLIACLQAGVVSFLAFCLSGCPDPLPPEPTSDAEVGREINAGETPRIDFGTAGDNNV